MPQYSIALALFDYLPVTFSACGLYYLLKALATINLRWQRIAIIGATLVISGGLLKASWKLIVASMEVDISWMNQSLFYCLAPGMLLLSGSFWLAEKSDANNTRALMLVAATAVIATAFVTSQLLANSKAASIFLLAVTVLANYSLVLKLILLSLQYTINHAAALFLFNILASSLMAFLARIPEQHEALQWVEQSINFSSQLAFSIACILLCKSVEKHYKNATQEVQ